MPCRPENYLVFEGDKLYAKNLGELFANAKKYLEPEDSEEQVYPEEVYEFLRLLGKRLGDRPILPQGFVLQVYLLVYDLKLGVDGYTGEKINSSLVGQPDMVYSLILTDVWDLLGKLLGESFKLSVDEVLKQSARN